MKILLKNSVRSLGRAGEVVDVRDGYARNYLLPRGIGIPASQSNVALIEKYKARRAEEEALLVEEYKEAIDQIAGLEIVLHMKANQSNHLYGSVSKGEVVTQLNNRHINVEKSMVLLDDPIKELGQYEVGIRFTEGLETKLKIEIRDEHGEIPVLEGSIDQEDDTNEGEKLESGDETADETVSDSPNDTESAESR